MNVVVDHSSHNRWIAGGLAAAFLVHLAGCSDQALGAPLPGAEPQRQASTTARGERPPASAAPGAPAPPPARPAALARDELLREAGRLAEIRAALARSPEAPLSLLDEHRAEFPEGRLAPDREIIAIDALVRRGRADQARARAEAFLARFPASPHAERVRRLTGAAP
ncbi:tol-pal system YbgF family protein [Sorangium cellulosum]|uniref:tetratricopeptide repeat protein n=1 Tax=Sorangium cellulosum TaxID=56 RepID=UPI003D9A1D52